jgi:VCBS repeat-containing protein
VTINVVNQPPVATNDSYTTNQNTPLTIAAPGVLTNDTDPGSQSLTAQLVSTVSHGTLTLNSNGSFTYTPVTDYVGTDSFTYQAYDGLATSNEATVTITINAVIQEEVKVFSPNGGEVVPSAGYYQVLWAAPSEAATFKFFYSVNNGAKWKRMKMQDLDISRRSSTWIIPRIKKNSPNCLVKVIGYDTSKKVIGSDISDTTFSIEAVKLTSPLGGETFTTENDVVITWTTITTLNVAQVKLFYTLNGGTPRKKIDTINGNPGTYTWKPPVEGTLGKIGIQLQDDNGRTIGQNTSDDYFAVIP